MNLPKGIRRRRLDAEVVRCHAAIHPIVKMLVTEDPTTSSERMTALVFVLIQQTLLAAATMNVMDQTGNRNAGTDLVDSFLKSVPEGIRTRTLQLRHAFDQVSLE